MEVTETRRVAVMCRDPRRRAQAVSLEVVPRIRLRHERRGVEEDKCRRRAGLQAAQHVGFVSITHGTNHGALPAVGAPPRFRPQARRRR